MAADTGGQRQMAVDGRGDGSVARAGFGVGWVQCVDRWISTGEGCTKDGIQIYHDPNRII